MWHYGEDKVESVDYFPKGSVGFVYMITDRSTGMKYIGKKLLWSTRKLPPLKGKTRRRTKITESNWKDYFGSSEEVQSLVEEKGEDNFHREILHICYGKGELSYMEAKEQFDRNALLDPTYHNGIIQVKIHRSHVKGLTDKLT